MLHNHEKLLIKLIEQYYSLLPSKVAKVLLYHGAITLKRAYSYSSLNRYDFDKGLNTLIQCDFVSISQIGYQKVIKIDPQKIIHILFYPHYLLPIGKRFGVESVSLVKTLFLYGRLSMNDLIERTLYHIIQTNSLEIIDDQIRFFISSLHENFNTLFSKKIIVYVNPQTTISNYNQELIFNMLKKNLDSRNHSTDYFPKLICKTSLLKLNMEALNYLYFIEMFQYLLNPPFPNEEANFVFNMLLEMTFEKSFRMKHTVLPYQKVFELYRAQYPNISMFKLQTVLTIFNHYFAPNFIKVGKIDCALNFDVFLSSLVKIIVKEFIKKNYGENSVRIFGALLEEVCIFEHNLLNSLKIDTKELHRNIYLLDQSRMINISFYSEANQSSTFSARNVKKALSVNLSDVVDCILKRCYYSIYTILHRRSIEVSSQKDLISRKNHIENYKKEIEEKVEDKEEKNHLIKTAHNYMSENDHKRAEALLLYDNKVDKVEYHLVNFIFVLNLWKSYEDQDDNDNQNDNKIDQF